MTTYPPHLRAKAIELRTKDHMTLDEIIERLQLPKTTVYGWIKDYPLPVTRPRNPQGQIIASLANQERAAAKRQTWYDLGISEAPTLLTTDLKVRDFVLMYIGEGGKKDRNRVDICNSDPKVVKLSHDVMRRYSDKTYYYRLQIHADHEPAELQRFWGNLLNLQPERFEIIRKSNSGQLSGRQFRSVYGVCTVQVSDTYFRARLQAWMDFVKSTW